jgi:transposase
MRANQNETLAYFQKQGDKGATISDVASKFEIRTSSARSRVLRCHANGWLKEKKEKGPTGPVRRFFIGAGGVKELAAS